MEDSINNYSGNLSKDIPHFDNNSLIFNGNN